MSFSQSLNGNRKKKIISRFLQWQLSVNLSIGVSIFGNLTGRAVSVSEYILLVAPNTWHPWLISPPLVLSPENLDIDFIYSIIFEDGAELKPSEYKLYKVKLN